MGSPATLSIPSGNAFAHGQKDILPFVFSRPSACSRPRLFCLMLGEGKADGKRGRASTILCRTSVVLLFCSTCGADGHRGHAKQPLRRDCCRCPFSETQRTEENPPPPPPPRTRANPMQELLLDSFLEKVGCRPTYICRLCICTSGPRDENGVRKTSLDFSRTMRKRDEEIHHNLGDKTRNIQQETTIRIYAQRRCKN